MTNSREEIFDSLRRIIPYPDIIETYIIEVSNLTSISLDETHHIIPKCLGGTDEPENLITLSYQDHYRLHQILSNTHIPGLVYAYWRMSNDGRITTPKQYEDSRKKFIECHSEFMKTNNPMSNEEFRQRMAESRKGMKFSEDHINNLSTSHKGISNNWEGRKHTEESKKKMSESHLGKHHSEETKLKISRNLPDRHGSNNPMYGFKSCWINNGLINKRIRVEDIFLYPDWSKGRLPNRSKEVLILEE